MLMSKLKYLDIDTKVIWKLGLRWLDEGVKYSIEIRHLIVVSIGSWNN